MHLIIEFFHFLLHINQYLALWINQYGTLTYGFIALILFCETGLVIAPFLPGDSLLFAAGSLFAGSSLNVHLLVIFGIIAVFCGDNVNYAVGRYLGNPLFTQKSHFLKPKYLTKTHLFLERYGLYAIFLARFVPIVRTYVPFACGMGYLRYQRFFIISLLAAVVWITLLIYLGYFFGRIAWVQKNFSVAILLVVLISVMPGIISALTLWFKKAKHP